MKGPQVAESTSVAFSPEAYAGEGRNGYTFRPFQHLWRGMPNRGVKNVQVGAEGRYYPDTSRVYP